MSRLQFVSVVLWLGSMTVNAASAAWSEDVEAASRLTKEHRYAEAEQRALAIWRPGGVPENHMTAVTLNNPGGFYHHRGVYVQAAQTYRKALAILESIDRNGSSELFATLNNIAAAEHAQANYGEAEKYYRRALAKYETEPAPAGVDIASALNNLGQLYAVQGRQQEAETLYRRALAVTGLEGRTSASVLNNLGALYRARSDYVAAEQFYRRLLTAWEATTTNEADTAATLHNLAEVSASSGAYAKAETLFTRALEIEKKVLTPGHPQIASTLASMALLRRAEGRPGGEGPA
jgi:tetratricopeptide (TPR) repeat protein